MINDQWSMINESFYELIPKDQTHYETRETNSETNSERRTNSESRFAKMTTDNPTEIESSQAEVVGAMARSKPVMGAGTLTATATAKPGKAAIQIWKALGSTTEWGWGIPGLISPSYTTMSPIIVIFALEVTFIMKIQNEKKFTLRPPGLFYGYLKF